MDRWPLQSQCDSFYGNPRAGAVWQSANLVHVTCPWKMHIEHTPVAAITIHRKCAESLAGVLDAIWTAVGKAQTEIVRLRYDLFDGSFNYRPMRGSQRLSMHAYGCAIDWDAEDNAFHSTRHLFRGDSLLVVKFREAGWVWGGEWSPPDAMHVQAARVRGEPL